MNIAEFRHAVYAHYAEAGRDFPWRRPEATPWGVLVSEFMLQQTQTERVIPYWERWMALWPQPKALSRAPLEDALREWSGLGYNRRCRFLRESARIIAEEHGGVVPQAPEALLALPGVGAYTAGAIACFAYNYPSVFIETNIRAAVIHFFFQGRQGVTDAEIAAILEKALDRLKPREWYWALMDYGAALKKITENPSRRGSGYVRQSRFEGSFRQRRGALLRALVSRGPATTGELRERTGMEEEDLYQVLDALGKDHLVAERDGRYLIKE
jgi:A/G-specific adenine glycosylase